MQLNLDERERFVLPSGEEVAREEREGLELQIAQQRIQDVLRVLGNFNVERQEGKSREEYVKQLRRDLAFYYGYNKFLISQILRLFPPPEAVEFLEANETPRPVTIRCNTLKVRRRDLAQSLIARGVNLDPLGDWSKVGLQVFESSIPIGATPEYLSGQYMLQGAASLLPVMALGALPGERVLDMCAAPGGKTTHIAQDMKNQGVLFANDVNRERISALTSNVHRMGVTNTIICNLDGTAFPGVIGGFDRVLCDAPCSGLGVICRDPRIKVSKTVSDIHLCRNIQKKLIMAAIDSVNAASPGAVIVYCTCTISVEENELIVQHALDSRDVELVDTELPFGKPGFTKYEKYRLSQKMSLCRRFYPHVHNTDGFFVAKLIKKSNNIKRVVAEQEHEEKEAVAARLLKKKKKVRGGSLCYNDDISGYLNQFHLAESRVEDFFFFLFSSVSHICVRKKRKSCERLRDWLRKGSKREGEESTRSVRAMKSKRTAKLTTNNSIKCCFFERKKGCSLITLPAVLWKTTTASVI